MAVVKVSAAPVAARLLRYMVKQRPNSKEPRVLFATGVNVRAETAEREFAAARRRYGQQGRGIQVRHVIQSFGLDELNPHDPADVARAHELGVLFAQECFPGVQALVVTQADGKGSDGGNSGNAERVAGLKRRTGGKLHNHIALNAVVTECLEVHGKVWKPGRKLSGELTHIDRVRERHDAMLARHGFTQSLLPVDDPRYSAERRTIKDYREAVSGRRSNHEVIRDAYWDALADDRVVDLDSLRAQLRVYGVLMNERVSRRGKPGEKHSLSFQLASMPTPVRGASLGGDYTYATAVSILGDRAAGREFRRRTPRQRSGDPKPDPAPATEAELIRLQAAVDTLAAAERAAQREDELDAWLHDWAAEELLTVAEKFGDLDAETREKLRERMAEWNAARSTAGDQARPTAGSAFSDNAWPGEALPGATDPPEAMEEEPESAEALDREEQPDRIPSATPKPEIMVQRLARQDADAQGRGRGLAHKYRAYLLEDDKPQDEHDFGPA